MIIKCTKCSTAFKINDKLIKKKGTSFRCSQCNKVFRVYLSESGQDNKSHIQIANKGLKKTDPKAVIEPLLDNFENALKQLLQSTQKLLDDHETQKSEIIEKKNHQSASDLSELLLRLDELLKNNDLEAEDTLNLLKSQPIDSELQNDLEILESYVNHLEFENARKILKKILQALNISVAGQTH